MDFMRKNTNPWMDPPAVEKHSFFKTPKILPESEDLMKQIAKQGSYIDYTYTSDGRMIATRRPFKTPQGALENNTKDPT